MIQTSSSSRAEFLIRDPITNLASPSFVSAVETGPPRLRTAWDEVWLKPTVGQ